MKYKLIVSALISTIFLFTSCKTDNVDDSIVSPQMQKTNTEILSKTNKEVLKELAMARKGTAKYHNIDKALADGYEDIGLFVEGMGWHFVKGSLIDGVFDPTMPEALVYHLKPNGEFRLVAVEYLSPGDAPVLEGFTGDEDVWEQVNGGVFWAVHAWIWYNNPEGIFEPLNSRL